MSGISGRHCPQSFLNTVYILMHLVSTLATPTLNKLLWPSRINECFIILCQVSNQQSLSVQIYTDKSVSGITWATTATTTRGRRGSAAVNGHILRMTTVFISKWISWAEGQSWFCTKTIDIVQPDSSTSCPKPVEQKSLRLCIPHLYLTGMASYKNETE